MEGKSSYFILLVIVAFLSITLAFLAIGFFFFGNGGSSDPSSKEVVVVTKITPTDSELSSKVLFENQNFNLKKTDEKQIAVIVLSASIKHYKITDKLKEAEVVAKIDFYKNEINSAISTYFQGLTLDDVRQIDAKQKASETLTKKINEILSSNDKKDSPIVYSMTFYPWFYQ